MHVKCTCTLEKEFIDDNGSKSVQKGKILRHEDGLYEVKFELEGGPFCCKMSSSEVESKLRRSDLGYKALDRSDFGD